MSTLRLLGLAAKAEGLVLESRAEAMAWRAMCVGAAGIFGGAALIMLHVAAWYALAPSLSLAWIGLLLAVFDLAVMGVLLLLAGKHRGRADAREAAALRDAALAGALRAVPLAGAALDLALNRRGSTISLAEAALRAFSAARR
jgi:hypothetical protein